MKSIWAWIAVLSAVALIAACSSDSSSKDKKKSSSPKDEGTLGSPIDITEKVPYDGTTGSDSGAGSYYCIGGLTPGQTYYPQISNTSELIYLGVYKDANEQLFGCYSNQASNYQSCSVTASGDTIYFHTYRTYAGNGENQIGSKYSILDPGTAGGSCGTVNYGTLTIDLTGAGLGSNAFSAFVYDSDGLLVGATSSAYTSFANPVYSASSDATSSSTDTGSGAVTLPAGDYTVYIEVDDGSGSEFVAGAHGYVGTVTIDGATTLALSFSEFETAVEQNIVISDGTAVLASKMTACWFQLPGTDIFNDFTQVVRQTDFAFDGSGNADTNSAGAFTAIVPGDYDMYCYATAGSINYFLYPTLASGDYVYQASVTVSATDLTVLGADFVAQ